MTKFRERLNSSEFYFNSEQFPKNESDKEAYRKCSDIEGAKKYCPKRWAALQLWFAEVRKVSFFSETISIKTGRNKSFGNRRLIENLSKFLLLN